MNDCVAKPFTPEDLYNKLVRFKTNLKRAPQLSKKIDTSKNMVDLTYLRNISNNNQKFIDEMLAAFIDSIPKSIEEIKKSVESEEWISLARSIHKLKPSLTLIGLHAGKEKALQLEELAKQQKDIRNIPALALDFCEELTSALTELRQLI